MFKTTPSSDSPAQTWLKDTPAPVQAAFEAMATMQLLQETADNAEAVLNAADGTPGGDDPALRLHRLTSATTKRLIEVSRLQIATLRALLDV
jgi:hypothetical protein